MSKKLFRTTQEIKDALFKIKSLTQEERKLILEEMIPDLDDGGVSEYELRERLSRVFYPLMKEGKISSTDYQNIKKLLNQ